MIRLAGGGLALAAALAALRATAGAQELRYTLTPTAEQLRWDDALGLDNSFLYGGRLGFVFGKLVELQGFYLTSQGTDSKIRDLYSRLNVSGTPPQNPGLDVMNYGANVVLNFGTGSIAPYVRGGGSIVRFEPKGGTASSRIALQYAGGLRLGKPGGLRLNVFAEDVRFRVDRTLLLAVPGAVAAGGSTVTDVDADKLRNNLAYGAGLTIPLGGVVTYNDAPTSSLTNLSLPLDVFAGRLDFERSLGLPRQYLVGARTGVDFGPLVGLRGFYWRGVSDDFKRTQRVQSYGGEAQFSLNSGNGLSPFIVLGAAQIDFKNGYQATTGTTSGMPGTPATPTTAAPADRMALIGGGGIKVPLLSHFIVTLAARDYVMAQEGRLQDVNKTGQLRNSWQYSAGLSLHIGGRTHASRPAPRTDTVFVDRSTGRSVARASDRMTRTDSRTDSTIVRTDSIVVTQAGDTLRGAAADSALAADSMLVRHVVVTRATGERIDVPSDRKGYASDRTTQIVVPTEGEIIVRYGPQRPAAPRPDDRRPDDRRPDDRPDARRPDDQRPADPRDLTSRERVYERDVVPGVPVSSGVSAAELREIVREEMRAENDRIRGTPSASLAPTANTRPVAAQPRRPAPRPPTRASLPVRKDTVGVPMPRMSEADMAALEQRIVDRVMARVDERIDARVRDQASRTPAAPASNGLTSAQVRSMVRDEMARAQPPVTIAPGMAPSVTTTVRETTTRAPVTSGVQGGVVYSGFTFSGGPQALLGARLDLGDVSPALPGFRLVPEVAFGFGQGATSTYVAGNLLYEFGRVPLGPLGRVRPRVALGAGFINFSHPVDGHDGLEVVFTPSYGVTTDLPPIRGVLRALTAGGRTPELLVEHQGIGFFDVNRLIIGLAYRR